MIEVGSGQDCPATALTEVSDNVIVRTNVGTEEEKL